jgi:outer membrane protein assembly factor BamB
MTFDFRLLTFDFKTIIIMKNYILIIYFLIPSFWSCEKNGIDSENNAIPKTLWRKLLGPSLSDQISYEPMLFGNNLLFGYQTDFTEGYYQFNKTTGDLIKRYDNLSSFEVTSFPIGNRYFSISGSRGRTINLNTHEIKNYVINFEFGVHSIFVSNTENSIFLGVRTNNNISQSHPLNEYKIMRAFNNNLNLWNDVWYNKYPTNTDILGVDIKYIAKESKPNGDEIIYIPSTLSFNRHVTNSKFRMEAANITTQTSLWQTEVNIPDSILSHGLSNFPPEIYNDVIIAGISGSHLVAFDKNTGKQLWSQYFADALLTTEMIINKGKISIMDNSRYLYQIDAISGKILRKQDLIVGSTRKWAKHNEKIYFTTATGKLFCIDANTHNVLWDIRSPNKDNCSYCNFYAASPVVDPATNRLYISDRKEVICYQLPK